MRKLWSVVDKKHRRRLPPRRWNRLAIIDDHTGKPHHGGATDKGPEKLGVLADGQLYFGLSAGCPGVSICFVRVYKDGRPDDRTGFQDYPRLGKPTLNVGPKWTGDMDDSYTLYLEERHSRGIVVQGNTIYKGWE